MISALKMESGNEHKTQWLQVQRLRTECVKTTMIQTFNLFCITISLFERLELLELRATSTAGKTMLFCVVSL